MTDHVLLEDDDGYGQGYSNTNPFAQPAPDAEQGDWKSKFGSFARRAGESMKSHAAKAAASAQQTFAEAKGAYRIFRRKTPHSEGAKDL